MSSVILPRQHAPSEPPALSVLVVDDDDATRASIALALDRLGLRCIEAAEAEWAFELYQRHQPEIVVSDIQMPGHDGLWLARQIRQLDGGHWTPILMLSSHTNEQAISAGIDAGADDYLSKPLHPVVLAAKLRAMQRLRQMQLRLVELSQSLAHSNRELQGLVERDALTGLINRRGLDDRLPRALADARRRGSPLTLMLCDVDHFKAYNDTLGHAAGDGCLKQVAQLLQGAARRPHDAAVRYGGEEFALILPDTPRSGAMTLARTVSRLFKAAAMPHPSSPTAPYVTVSGGITTCIPDAGVGPDDLLRRADEALYIAKSLGRDRFFSFETRLDSVASRAAGGETSATTPGPTGLRATV